MKMAKEEFKRRWESGPDGGGITNDDCADCFVAWGLGSQPRTMPIKLVVDAVVSAAGCNAEGSTASDINSMKDFEDKFHYRVAERCCGNCAHGGLEYEGGGTCHHPERFDYGHDDDCRISSYNVMQCCVCDAWKKKDEVKQ